MSIIRVVVKPGSKRESVETQGDGSLIVRVRARAVEGQANERLIEILAEQCGCRRNLIRIVSGHTARIKLVEVPTIVGHPLRES